MGSKEELADLINDIVRVSREMGKIPTRDEYISTGKYKKHSIDRLCNSYTIALQMAGLKVNISKPNKQEYLKRTYQHLQQEVSVIKNNPPEELFGSKILIIGDTHYPYTHQDAADFLIALNRKYNFDLVLHAGDEVDYHAISFHDHDPDLLSAGHELEAAISGLTPIYNEFPRVILAESNHGSLVYRKGKHHGLPRQVLKSYKEILRAPDGWEWRPEIVVKLPNGHKFVLNHAYNSNVLLGSKKKGRSLVQGHLHTAFSIQKWANDDQIYFAAQTGCLIDDVSFAFAYNKTIIERPILGSMGIFNGEPKLFPLTLNGKGRWTGEVP